MVKHIKNARGKSAGGAFNWGAALLAGLFAGGVFLLLELLATWVFGAGSPFGPAHVTLQGLLGREATAGGPNGGLVLAAFFLHFSLAIFLTLVLARVVHTWRMGMALVVSMVLGYLLYFLNVHLFAYMLPVLGTARDVFLLVNYVLFGVSGAWAYKRLQQHFAAPHAAPRMVA
jgi:hypothetical protein